MLASGTVLAAEWFGWNPTIAEKFQPSEEQQETLPEEGVIQDVSQTVTHNRVGVTLTQVLHDDYNLSHALRGAAAGWGAGDETIWDLQMVWTSD